MHCHAILKIHVKFILLGQIEVNGTFEDWQYLKFMWNLLSWVKLKSIGFEGLLSALQKCLMRVKMELLRFRGTTKTEGAFLSEFECSSWIIFPLSVIGTEAQDYVLCFPRDRLLKAVFLLFHFPSSARFKKGFFTATGVLSGRALCEERKEDALNDYHHQ